MQTTIKQQSLFAIHHRAVVVFACIIISHERKIDHPTKEIILHGMRKMLSE